MQHSKAGKFTIGLMGAAIIYAIVVALIIALSFAPNVAMAAVIFALLANIVLHLAAVSRERPFIAWGLTVCLMLAIVVPPIVVSACASAFRF